MSTCSFHNPSWICWLFVAVVGWLVGIRYEQVNTELNRNLVPWPLQWPVRLLLSLLLRSPDQVQCCVCDEWAQACISTVPVACTRDFAFHWFFGVVNLGSCIASTKDVCVSRNRLGSEVLLFFVRLVADVWTVSRQGLRIRYWKWFDGRNNMNSSAISGWKRHLVSLRSHSVCCAIHWYFLNVAGCRDPDGCGHLIRQGVCGYGPILPWP